ALEYEAPAPGSYTLPPLGAASDAAFVDSHGRHGRLHELFDGRVTVLSFIYTQCDDANGCPLASYVMSRVGKRLEADPEIRRRLRLVSFSFDLEHDTPPVLERYAGAFRSEAEWDFVVAPDAPALTATLDAYQQSVQRTGGHAFAHILRVFLIDGSRRIRNIYSTSFLHADTLANDVRTLLIEQGDIAPPAAATAVAGADGVGGTGGDATDPALGLPPPAAMNGPAPTAAQVRLGERLFFDRRLSLNRTISCAMCHVPGQGYAVNELATAVGIEGRTVKRNAPTLLNVGYLRRLFHDARESRLEYQVWSPLLAHNEMDNPSVGYVVEHLERWPGYAEAFREAFGGAINMESIGAAFAAYQRSLVAGGSAFDRYLYGGDRTALDARARQGLELFRGRAGCSGCHTIGEQHALLTDEALHNTGVGYLASMGTSAGRRRATLAPGTTIEYDLAYVAPSAERKPNDLGRYEVTEDPDDRWKYRTPTLRNVALTAPYMHDGSLSTLAAVVEFYDRGGVPNPLLDPRIHPLGLTADERAALVAFLESLTSPAVARLEQRAREVEISNPTVAGR
ncbi:MAG: cytochrome c peroxidase, partial [Gammaproteobacteria bacterium]